MTTRVPVRGRGPKARGRSPRAKAGSATRSTARSQSFPTASSVATYGFAWSGRRTRICRASAITWAFVMIRPPEMKKPLPEAPLTPSCRQGCDQSKAERKTCTYTTEATTPLPEAGTCGGDGRRAPEREEGQDGERAPHRAVSAAASPARVPSATESGIPVLRIPAPVR